MTKRKKNPPPYFERMGRKITKKRRTSEQVKLAHDIKNRKYRERAKKLRESHLFDKTVFNAKDGGVDLRKDPDTWPATTKARITKYYKELAPRLAGDYIVKRYYKPGRIKAAAAAASQRKLLPGQKAVAFSVDKGQQLEVSFDRKNKITVKRGGIEENKLFFDPQALIDDPVAEVERVLATTNSKVFKFITGENESKDGYTRSALITAVERWVIQYAEDDAEEGVSAYQHWLFGLIEYPKLRVTTKIEKRSIKHEAEVKKRQNKRLVERSKDQRAMTAAEKKSIKLTGRSGRVK